MKNLLKKHFEEPTVEFILKLRHGNPHTWFDKDNKYFYHIQLNKKAKCICWQRHASKDRRNWIEYNYGLSLKEVLDFRAQLAIKAQARCFNSA
jgi:dienelactone hydrolase